MIDKVIVMILITLSLQAGEIVVDTQTGMMWQDSSTVVARDYLGAKEYCSELSLGGYSDWKLPNIDELMSISDKTRYHPAIKRIFENTKINPYWSSSWYWSSSEYMGDSSQAWSVDFYDGRGHSHSKSDKLYVRCVRVGD